MADTQVFLISELYPQECSVVRSTLDEKIRDIKNAVQADPITVVIVDGCQVVRNGAHRVLAAKKCGETEVLGVLGGYASSEEKAFRDALSSAQKRDRKGFENVPIDDTYEDRIARTSQEISEDFGFSV